MGQNRIICAKGTADVNAGNNTWSRGTPMTQTEAATELIINRLQVIDLLQRGKISSDSTIVTLPERKFLYENIFNIINYIVFISITLLIYMMNVTSIHIFTYFTRRHNFINVIF